MLLDKFNGIKKSSEELQKDFDSQMKHMGRTEQLQLELAIASKEIELDLLKQDRKLRRSILTLRENDQRSRTASISASPSSALGRNHRDRGHAEPAAAAHAHGGSVHMHRNTDDLLSRMFTLSRPAL